ncbi:MAG: hypothetical protein Q8P90_05570 [bacterium]|nr:hypothetical protein [bacterium]
MKYNKTIILGIGALLSAIVLAGAACGTDADTTTPVTTTTDTATTKVEVADTADAGFDQTTPEGTIELVFLAASIGDMSLVADLCDPTGDNDGDTQAICDLGTDAIGEATEDEFVQVFAAGKVTGDAVIEADEATVPFMFGQDGTDEETMTLINRDGMWYLYSF